MMDNQRYEAEKGVLIEKLGSNLVKFMDMNTSRPYVLMGARTNRGNTYTLKVELQDFPNQVPKVFITAPKRPLCDRSGSPMTEASASMHTLPAENGCTRICHYGFSSWKNNVALYKVYIKARMWLEVYEMHLQTGHPLNHYLKEQQ